MNQVEMGASFFAVQSKIEIETFGLSMRMNANRARHSVLTEVSEGWVQRRSRWRRRGRVGGADMARRL